MKQISLIYYLEVLTKDEIRHFGNFLKKYYHRNTQARKLFEVLKKWHPKYRKTGKLNTEFLCKEVFGKDVTESTEMRSMYQKLLFNLFSDLKQAYEDFAFNSLLDKNTYIKEIILIETYKKQDAPRVTRNMLAKAARNFDKADKATCLWPLYSQLQLRHRSYYNNLPKPTEERFVEIGLLNHTLDQYYIIHKLKYSCELLNLQIGTGKKATVASTNTILALSNSFSSKMLVHEVYHYAFIMLLHNDHKEFMKLYNLFVHTLQ